MNFRKTIQTIRNFFEKVIASYIRNDTDEKAAALALYAILSLPSLIVVIVSFGSIVIGQAETKQRIADFIMRSLDEKTGQAFLTIINTITASSQKTPATIVSFFILIWTAIALFEHLSHSLYTIWGIEKKEEQGLAKLLLNKFFGLLFMLLINVTIVLSFSIQNLFHLIDQYGLHYQQFSALAAFLNLAFSFALPFLLFLFIFKILTHAPISWKDASIGAFITSLLFVFGNSLLGIYFQNFGDYSAFGAANAVITTLVWIYYTSQIIFVGAEITALFAKLND